MVLKEKLVANFDNSFNLSLEEFKACLDKLSPLKEIKIRTNNSIFMTKGLRKAILLRYQLNRKYKTTNPRKILRNTKIKKTIV